MWQWSLIADSRVSASWRHRPCRGRDEIALGSAISQTGKYAREGKFYVDAYTLTVDAVNRRRRQDRRQAPTSWYSSSTDGSERSQT